ncbi:hypothetical protein TNCV_520441 [Trichonephila clavipes]|nr:hypothetical protein TNCV_520441 [Trichonephila clavipes]
MTMEDVSGDHQGSVPILLTGPQQGVVVWGALSFEAGPLWLSFEAHLQHIEEMSWQMRSGFLRWNTTENDVPKNQSSGDSAIRLPNTSILNSNAANM